MTPALRGFLDNNPALPTPFLALDLDVVEHRYHQLQQVLPLARVLYAVKANPAREVLERLAESGSCFDVASPGEIDRCLKLGIEPSRLAYGNTIKKERDIAYAFYRGITTFTVDAEAELEKVARQAPGATVYVRLATDGRGADWPLSRKFGCDHDGAVRLARSADRAGMKVGLSFHVGSQQRDVNAWDEPLGAVAFAISELASHGVAVAGVNLGGGLPSRYREPVAGVDEYGTAIRAALARHLGGGFAGEILIEPGRYLVGDAGLIETEVVLISRRPNDEQLRWVYLDIGMFNGLTETLGEAIRYRLDAPGLAGPDGPVILAGPSCDSADVLYERSGYRLPWSLKVGDHVRFFSTGAYTSSYSSVWFNGFEPLRCFYVTASQEPEVAA